MNMMMKKKFLDQYQSTEWETGVSEATPYKLVEMLYDGTLTALAKAKGFIERGEFKNKAQVIGQVSNIMITLRSDLDFEVGGEVATNLDALYEYIGRICLEASRENDIEKLDEAMDLVKTLKEGWAQMPENFKHATAEQLQMAKKAQQKSQQKAG